MKILDFIIADDIRQEIGNKISIMGVFGDEIIVMQDPAVSLVQLKLGLFIRIAIEADDVLPNNFKLQIFLDNKKLGEASAPISGTEESKTITVALPFPPLPISNPGILKFDYSFNNNEIEILKKSESIAITYSS